MAFNEYSEKYELNDGEYVMNYAAINGSENVGLLSSELDTEPRITRRTRAQSSNSSDLGIVLPPMRMNDPGLHFRNSHKRIDYLLIYEASTTLENQNSHIFDNTLLLQHLQRNTNKFPAYREKFLSNLRKQGLDIEEEVLTANSRELGKRRSTSIHFIKLSAPWSVLTHYAEELGLRVPLQAHPNLSSDWSESIFRFCGLPNPLHQYVPNKPIDYYTCPFKKFKLNRFLGHEDQENFFNDTQRIIIMHEILKNTVYGKRKKAQIGIDRMVEEKIYTAAFPLHDGPYIIEPGGMADPTKLNRRQVLYEYWAKWSRWYKYQPLDHIREYFGEKVAMYFAWLGFYTGWLLPAAIVGVLVFLYGLASVADDIPSNEICESNKTYRMCPTCEEKDDCVYWYLDEVCFFSKLSYLFDHPGTVFYAIFVSFWAVAFLEYWKRKSASLAHHWDCMDYETEEEKPRPEFAAKAPTIERNPVTGLKEPSFPPEVRLQRMVAGLAAMFLMVSLVLIFLVGVIVYRVLVAMPLFKIEGLRGWASIIASSTGAVMNLCLIMALGRVYERLAIRLTEWEMHRTQTEFDDQLIFKVFIFQFINFYSSIFYIAFFKGRFVGYPGHYTHMFGLRNEDCSNSGCLMELAQQLAIIMIGKQVINNAQEILWPKLKTWWHKKKTKFLNKEALTRWEEDYQLINYEGLFQEYLEMILQFGFITIFVAAFPLAPLFALLNNWVEIRLDAQKLVCETRRPVAERAQNIGVWFSILTFLAHLAVISNAFLIAFTSEFLPKVLYRYENDFDLKNYLNFTLAFSPANTTKQSCRYRQFRDPEGHLTPFYWKLMFVRFAFVCVFEHLVFTVCQLIDVFVPDIPKSLELKIKRERYLAKQALMDSEMIHSFSQGGDHQSDQEEVQDADDDHSFVQEAA